MLILEAEMENVISAILSKGFDLSDFEFIEQEEQIQGVEGPIKGFVKVKRKSNGAQKTYKAGHGSHWAADFIQDLKWGVFT